MNATEFMFTELSGLESFFRESICVGFFFLLAKTTRKMQVGKRSNNISHNLIIGV